MWLIAKVLRPKLMKSKLLRFKRLKSGWPIAKSLVKFLALWLCFSVLSVAEEPAAKVRLETRQIETMADSLGVTTAARQADRIIDQNLSRLGQSINESQRDQLRRQLQAAVGTEVLLASLVSYMVQQQPAASLRAQSLLSEPIVLRIRNFDVAMEMDSAFDKFQAYSQRLAVKPASRARQLLMQRLDKALQSSIIAAQLQSEIEQRTATLAASLKQQAPPILDLELTKNKQQQRQVHMAEVFLRLNLFSYRYVKDDELLHYVELLESDSIQALLDVGIQGLLRALGAEE